MSYQLKEQRMRRLNQFMPHTFGCAADLYHRRIHPRILVGPDDIVRLRQQVRRGDGLKLFNAICQKIAPLVDRLVVTETPEALDTLLDPGKSIWASFANQVENSIHDMAMVAVLADDERALVAVRRMLADAPPRRRGNFFGYHAYAYDLLHEHLPADVRLRYTTEQIERAHKLIEPFARTYYANAGLNGVLVNMFIALHLVLAVRGDPGAPSDTVEPLLAKLVSYLRATMHTAINPDGYPEEDVGYGTSVVCSLAKISHAVFRAGLWDAYEECPRFRKAGRAILHFVQPWGDHLAATGDFGGASCDHRENLLAHLAHANRDPALLWLLGTLHNDNRILKPKFAVGSDAREVVLRNGFQVPATGDTLAVLDLIGKPVHPAKAGVPTAFRDSGRGIVSFRDRWADDGAFVVFDGAQRSPAAPGHPHYSGGHFSLTTLGEYFAIDMNRYGTEQCDHNITLVDGRSGRSTGGQWCVGDAYNHARLIDYQPGELVDTAAVDSSLQHDCYWARRTILFVKGKYAHPYLVTIDDINKANDFHEFWWTLNTCPENVIKLHDTSATITGWRMGNHLDVHFALPAPKEFPKPHKLMMAKDECTTSSYNYIPDPRQRASQYVRPAAMVEGIVFVRPRLIAKVAGYNGRFMAAMLPRRKGEKPATVERLVSLPSSLALRITWEKVEDTLVWAYEHNLLEAGDVRGVGQWCVVRRARPSGRVIHYAMGAGTSLSVGGKRLPLPERC
ncbi:MAG: hypothetical protein NTW19_08190 [Planctomycetota bacterium]|nr:hypothetical protein [Planctomycetota bacterium]